MFLLDSGFHRNDGKEMFGNHLQGDLPPVSIPFIWFDPSTDSATGLGDRSQRARLRARGALSLSKGRRVKGPEVRCEGRGDIGVRFDKLNELRGGKVPELIGGCRNGAGPSCRSFLLQTERPALYGMPNILCVCRLNRQRGCVRQYSSASRVLRSRCGPSIGCKKNCRKSSPANRSGSAPGCG